MLRLLKHPQSGPAGSSIHEGGTMNSSLPELEFTEPERYELHEGPFYHFEISRRKFGQVLGAGLLISVAVPKVFAQRAGGGGGRGINLAQPVHIRADRTITVLTSKGGGGPG